MTTKQEPGTRSIEELTDEYKRLNERKITTEANLKTATEQLEALQKEAETEFGTCDIEELKAKLAEMDAENEKRRSEYQTLLEGIAADLEKVEQDNASGTPADSTDAD